MSDDIKQELAELLKKLPKHQLDAIKEVCGSDEEEELPRYSRKVLKEEKVHLCKVSLTCRLCGTVQEWEFPSVSTKDTKMETPTCDFCQESLLELEHLEVVVKAIAAADGEWTRVKEAKNAPVEFKWGELRKERGDEGEETENAEGCDSVPSS